MTAMARPALLYFLLWLGVTLSSAMDLEKRIIGGQPCGNNDRLYHVSLVPPSCHSDECFCGGSLIREQWVLTAAHCLEPLETVRVVVNVHPGTNKQDLDEIDIPQNNIYRHPNGHDIMLLKLPRKPKKILKSQIPNIPDKRDCKTDIKINDKFQVAGHGYTQYDQNKKEYVDDSPTKLLCLDDVPVVDCGLPKTEGICPYVPYDNTFCAKDPGNKWQTAPGDSGSGVLFKGKIYGIVRSGPKKAFAGPFVFVRVCSYRKWIEETTK